MALSDYLPDWSDPSAMSVFGGLAGLAQSAAPQYGVAKINKGAALAGVIGDVMGGMVGGANGAQSYKSAQQANDLNQYNVDYYQRMANGQQQAQQSQQQAQQVPFGSLSGQPQVGPQQVGPQDPVQSQIPAVDASALQPSAQTAPMSSLPVPAAPNVGGPSPMAKGAPAATQSTILGPQDLMARAQSLPPALASSAATYVNAAQKMMETGTGLDTATGQLVPLPGATDTRMQLAQADALGKVLPTQIQDANRISLENQAKLGQIGAEGAQNQQNAAFKASITPHEMTLVDGTTIHTNDLDASKKNIEGMRNLNEQQKNLLTQDTKTLTELRPAYDSSVMGMATVEQIRQLAQIAQQNPFTRPGPGADQATAVLNHINDTVRRMGGNPVSDKELASAQGINKLAVELQAQATTALGKGEAASVFNRFGDVQPNIHLPGPTLNLLLNTMQEKSQRNIDRFNIMQQAMTSPHAYGVDPQTGQYITGSSALSAYDMAHPGEDYATQANQASGMTPTGWSIKKIDK